jgi:hypothetical protein
VSTAERPRKPRQTNRNQPIVSALLDRETLEDLRAIARVKNETVSDLVRRAIAAYRPQLLLDVGRALALSREADANDNNEEERED